MWELVLVVVSCWVLYWDEGVYVLDVGSGCPRYPGFPDIAVEESGVLGSRDVRSFSFIFCEWGKGLK
jgi:hypothetical protein